MIRIRIRDSYYVMK